MALLRQKLLFCPDCGGRPAIAGFCVSCYRRRRHSLRYFAGVRDQVLRRDRYQCQGCQTSRGAGNQPSVHHRRHGVHDGRWLVTVCPACHAVIHKLLSNRHWLPVPLLELWREQHPAVPLQGQLGIDASDAAASDPRGREAACTR